MATEIHYIAAQMGQASPSGRLDPPLLMGLDEVTQICPVPLPSWLSDSGGKGIQVVAVVHGEAQLTGRWGDHGRQVVLDTSSVKVFLPGITDVTTLDAAAKLCGQASWKVRGQDHATRHDVATPDMIRQLPAGFALVIRGGCAPVIARLPRAWKNPAYRRARRLGQLPAEPAETARVPGPRAAGPRHPRPRARRMAPRQRHLLPLELTMTPDPITAALQQLADHHEQLTQLTELITGIGDTLREHEAALAKLAETPPADADPDRYRPSPPPAWWKLAAADRQEPIARLHAWVEQVYRPGYGHLAATLAPCWSSHDLCLYGLDILSDLWSVLYLQPERTPRMLSAQAEYQARILPALAAQLMTETTSCGHTLPHLAGGRHDRRHPPPGPGLRPPRLARLPLPARPEDPRHQHGYQDATTDEQQITEWFGRGFTLEPGHRHRRPRPRRPGRRPARPSRKRLPRLRHARARGPGRRRRSLRADPGRRDARLLHRLRTSTTAACPATTWTSAPTAATSSPRPPRSAASPTGSSRSSAATAAWTGPRSPGSWNPSGTSNARRQARPRTATLGQLARWVASQPEGNRNSGLYWAANRALDADPAADLSPLAAAARQAGLGEPEITRTLDSARKTSHQAEAVN